MKLTKRSRRTEPMTAKAIEAAFVKIIDLLCTDRAMRELAAYGSAALSDNPGCRCFSPLKKKGS